MICKACGRKLPDGAMVCKGCGTQQQRVPRPKPESFKDTMNRKDYDKAVAVRDSLIRMKDSTLIANLPAISGGLAKICPALDSAGYYNHIKLGMEKHVD